MKKVQLGLLAVALFGAVAAFANTATDLHEGWYTDDTGNQQYLGDPIADGCVEQPNTPICAVRFENDQPVETVYLPED